MSSSSESSWHRHRHKKRQQRSHHSRSSSRDSSQLLSLIDSLRQELADNRASFLLELTKISSRVAVMEGQSPLTPQTITYKQSLVIVSTPEQSSHQAAPSRAAGSARRHPRHSRRGRAPGYAGGVQLYARLGWPSRRWNPRLHRKNLLGARFRLWSQRRHQSFVLHYSEDSKKCFLPLPEAWEKEGH